MRADLTIGGWGIQNGIRDLKNKKEELEKAIARLDQAIKEAKNDSHKKTLEIARAQDQVELERIERALDLIGELLEEEAYLEAGLPRLDQAIREAKNDSQKKTLEIARAQDEARLEEIAEEIERLLRLDFNEPDYGQDQDYEFEEEDLELGEFIARIEDLKKGIARLDRAIEEAKNDSQKKTLEIARAQDQVELERLEAGLEEVRKEEEDRILEGLRAEARELVQGLENLDQAIKEAKNDSQKKTLEIARAQDQVELERIERALDLIGELLEEDLDLEFGIFRLDQAIKEAKNDSQKKTLEIARAQDEARLEEIAEEIDRLLRLDFNEPDYGQDQDYEFEEEAQDQEELVARIKDLKQGLANLDQAIREAKNDSQKKTLEIARAQDQQELEVLEAALEEVLEEKQLLADLKAEREALIRGLANLEKALEGARNDSQKKNLEIAIAQDQAELEEVNRKISELEGQ